MASRWPQQRDFYAQIFEQGICYAIVRRRITEIKYIGYRPIIDMGAKLQFALFGRSLNKALYLTTGPPISSFTSAQLFFHDVLRLQEYN